MKMMRPLLCAAATLAVCALPCLAQSYRYARVGKPDNVTVTPRPGFALMGGGSDLDEAFKWLCERGAGGDLVVLRSHGSNDYNPYIAKLCKMNSVATLVIGSRTAAEDPFVASTIAHASAIFIAGGDQGEYTTFWMRTPVQTELNAALKRGVPIGGTSAGLAVLGQFIYTSLGDKPDEAIWAIVKNWSTRIDAKRAAELGFVAERSFDEIVQAHIDDELGGKVPAL